MNKNRGYSRFYLSRVVSGDERAWTSDENPKSLVIKQMVKQTYRKNIARYGKMLSPSKFKSTNDPRNLVDNFDQTSITCL